MAAMSAHTQALTERVYGEIVARIQQDDSTVPYRKRGYWYYTRYEAGKEYPVYARKARTLDAPEQVMLNANELGAGHGFYQVGGWAIAPNDQLLAYADDTVGRRQHTLRFKDLATGRPLPDAIPNVEAELAWNADSTSILYVEKDPSRCSATVCVGTCSAPTRHAIPSSTSRMIPATTRASRPPRTSATC